ncbi:MAG: hypothetical protein JRJ47_14185, partial [Deltaproteobacteria bacterium]|nr:hypothetical protein [Deltaproteobacteria bacterium]
TILIVVGVLFWVLSCGDVAAAFDFHADSAHGDNSEGVNRKDVVSDPDHPDAYNIGECAHCHDTFNDSICGVNDLMLFSTQYFCVQCHQYPASSYQVGMPYQGCYSYKFGGDTTITCPSSIKSAFLFINQVSTGQPVSNCGSNNGSAHYLPDIRVFLQNKWGFGDTSDDINLCEGCHNPHRAQQHNYPVGSQGTSPISLPSTHDGNWDVYGAKTTERMNSYASPYTYLAPRNYPRSAGGYEPDGGTQQNGANIPDYVTFCTDCHNSSNDIWSTQLGRYLHKFDWATEKHGRGAATDDDYEDFYWYGGPYLDSQAGSYVMSCMDCHEAHGSSNSYLARATVNGGSANLTRGDVNPWGDWCRRCHARISHDPGPHTYSFPCTQCHPTIVDPPGVGNTCDCHYHGAGPGVGGL